MIDTSKWPVLDLEDEYAASRVYQRLVMLFRDDPFMRMLGEKSFTDLANAICSDACLGGSKIKTKTNYQVALEVRTMMQKSHFALLLTDRFVSYIVGLVQTAVLANRE